MGYTHYWRRHNGAVVDNGAYEKALADMRAFIARPEIAALLVPGIDDGVLFNGKDAHEDFFLPATITGLQGFDFCKTAAKPYDLAVVGCLCILGQVPGIRVTSDGRRDDWRPGSEAAGAPIPAGVRE